MGRRPTDFPGLVIDPYRQCVVNQIELARFPVRVCECFNDCTNPGAPFPMLTECFLYGLTFGNLEKGCPQIIQGGGALGVTVGFIEAHFFVKLDLGSEIDFLQSPSADPTNTALRFSGYVGKPVGIYEIYMVDGDGNRAYISFAPSVGAVLWINVPLMDFVLIDAGVFDFTRVRSLYFGFTNNFQVSECMLAFDCIRVVTNIGGAGAIGPLSFGPDIAPYCDDNMGDVIVGIEYFEQPEVLDRITCDAEEPGPPPSEECDRCVLGPPLTDGNQAVHFCVDTIPPSLNPPSIRYQPPGVFVLTTDITFTVYSWRPGVGIRIVLRDSDLRRAIYDFASVGGSETITVPLASFSYPDAGFDPTQGFDWWTIFGTTGYNTNDHFALDELKTNGGATLIHDMSTLTDIYCGYAEEPPAPYTSVGCDWAMVPSVLFPPTGVKMDVLEWTKPLTITTVSQPCDDMVGYWDIGFDTAVDPLADVQIGFNLPIKPVSLVIREILLTLFDEMGRELMIQVAPPDLVLGNNLITIPLNGNLVSQPTLDQRGQFDARRVMYWQLGFVGLSCDLAFYPFTINFEGFQFRVNGAPTKQFLFNNYGLDPDTGKIDFEAKGGYSCYEDWRLVKIAPSNTPFEFLGGAGATVNMDPTFPTLPVRYIGLDKGKRPISDNRTDLMAGVHCSGLGFNPGYALSKGWNQMDLSYKAQPDSGVPTDVWFVIQDVLGQTGTYKFNTSTGALNVDGIRTFNVSRGSMNRPMGDILFNFWRHFQIVKERITNQPRTGTVPTGKDQFSGDELDFVQAKTIGETSIAYLYGKLGNTTVDSIRDNNKFGSIAMMGGDDQPDKFNGHVHHEADCGANTSAGDPPPGWPFATPPYHQDFDGWIKIYKMLEGPGVMDVRFPQPIDLSGLFQNPLAFFQIFAIGTNYSSLGGVGGPLSLETIADVQLILKDNTGKTASINFGPTINGGSGTLTAQNGWLFPINTNTNFIADDFLKVMLFRLVDATITPPEPPYFNWAAVTGYELTTTHENPDGWRFSKTWFLGDYYGEWDSSPTHIYNWNRSTWPNLIGFHNPSNQFSVGKALDPGTTPVVALNCDRTHKIAYWGMHEDWIRAADIVLIPEKYKDDPIVGINGNRGYDPDGLPLPGVLEALARDTRAWYGNAAFRIPPFEGCRNIWMDLCYIEEVVCLSADLEKTLYEFWDAECECVLPENIIYVSNLTTDKWLDRILPDDQFVIEMGAQPLPSGYPEAIYFEHCAIPDCDQEAVDDTDPDFKITRRTPTCSRPDDPLNTMYGHYRVEIEVEAKTGPVTVNWADVLNPGETLMSGVMAGSILLVNPGDTYKWEYIIKTGQLQGGSIIITGAAWAVNPPVTLISPAISMDIDCNTLSWNSFGSQNPNVFGTVFWAGGGRPDPVVPLGVNFWTKMWNGPGSAGLSKREQYLFANTTVPLHTTYWTFQLGGTGVEGFATDIPVWVFNSNFVDNPARKITGLDIEAEEVAASPNEEVTGLYGKVVWVNAVTKQIRVEFHTQTDQQVRFTIAASACIMVAPNQSRGYYWEASPDLVDLCKIAPVQGVLHSEIRWGFHYWNSTKYPAIDTHGAGYICDGDGESHLYEFHGEEVRRIINPVDWMDLLCSPVLETKLSWDAPPMITSVKVCDYCLFQPCDIIQIVDEACTGKEGSGPGYVGAVSQVVPDIPAKDCATYYAAEGHVKIIPPIPVAVSGCGVIDGFKTTRRARAFVKPDVSRYAYGPTTKVDQNGVPVEGQNFVGVDFATGTFTFIPEIVVSNPCACFKVLNSSIQLPRNEEQALLAGIYFLKGIDKSGCKSPPSKPIKVVGPEEEPEDCGVGVCPILLIHKTLNGEETQFEEPRPIPQLIAASTFAFSLSVPSRVEIRVSAFGFDALGFTAGIWDDDAWTELWAKNEVSGLYYPLADRLIKAVEGGELEAVAGDSGAGAAMTRVLDLPAGSYTFSLRIINGTKGWARLRYPIDIQVWRLGKCTQMMPPPPQPPPWPPPL